MTLESVAIELEGSDLRQDYRRRQRIAAGNVQQLFRLRSDAPKHRGTAFAFASGKGSTCDHAVIDGCGLIGSLVFGSPIAGVRDGGRAQVLLYSLATLPRGLPKLRWPQPIEGIHYLVSGYVSASLA